MNYNPKTVEKKWQAFWQQHPYQTKPISHGKKFYCLDMFPYPSGSGLHVGHWRGYVLSDVYARIKWLEGYNVLHPMGWDAFGLPAENDAIKKKIHPKSGTAANIANFKKQLFEIGALYDWSKELDTTNPSYYKWTQWIFLQMYQAGLAYESNMPINWCPSCLTGLANEEVVNHNCDRCGTPVVTKNIRQWVLRITDYAEKLLAGLDNLPLWSENVKNMQRNWIGKSEGLLFTAPVKDVDLKLETFSAHFEAFAADSFVVIAPDHALLKQLLTGISNQGEILEFCEKIIQKRIANKQLRTTPELEGIFTGRYLLDPVSGQQLPIWVASFAIADYGTGVVKCSAHDERDFAFAKKYQIPLKVALVPQDPILRAQVENLELCYTDMQNGILLAPAAFAGQKAGDCRDAIIKYCQAKGYATSKVSYKLRDWIFSRQRYWGEPIPLVHCATCGIVPVPEKDLPVMLPDVKNYEPTGTGESPLAAISDWVNTTCPKCAGAAKRETNTMPQWAGSCWYFLRYPNPDLADKPFDQADLKYWLPVDLYVGGIEHAILHLLYARFYVKVLYDLGYVPFNEPFTQLFNQGMVCKYSEKSGSVEKMSKSKGNVVNPDEIVQTAGSDALRLYILFMGPPELDCEWQDNGLEGIKRFLAKIWRFALEPNHVVADTQENLESQSCTHKFLQEFQNRLALFKPNTAISSMMEWLNTMQANKFTIGKTNLEKILVSLSVLAPHIASELLELIFNKKLENCTWPDYNEALTVKQTITISVQVNGKMRGSIVVAPDESEAKITKLAQEVVAKWLADGQLVKTIVVPGRTVNFVVKL
jgi:leucyl-tRNA synthetase